MESGRGSIRQALAAFTAVAFVVSACAAPPEAAVAVESDRTPTDLTTGAASQAVMELPDITMRTIAAADLEAMLPGTPTVRDRTNESLVIAATLDRQDQSADIVLHGRSTGIAAEYQTDDGPAFVWVDVLADPDSAHDYLADHAGDIAKGVDGTHDPAAALTGVKEFAISAGEESVGLIGTLGSGDIETLVITRVGRLVVFASQVRPTNVDVRVPLQYLVDDVVAQILAGLTGDAVEVIAPKPGYRFQTTVIVSTPTETWTTSAAGTVSRGNFQCAVERDTPTTTDAVEIVAVDRVMWRRDGEASYVATSGANASTALLRLWCPAWPLEAATAGLAQLTTSADPPRHHVNGVDASGYQGTTTDLAAVMGSPLPGVAVDTFSFWVADGSDWIIELAIVATGPASSLTPLIGPGFASHGDVNVSVRHRVFDLDAVEPIPPPK
jgi:hypothetical protein